MLCHSALLTAVNREFNVIIIQAIKKVSSINSLNTELNFYLSITYNQNLFTLQLRTTQPHYLHITYSHNAFNLHAQNS